ncbi:uncharacterized protein LOC134178499 [Corticium candelabrum]|uniref:uncharacterized protein LOC134178499 n=1 Tax=Corticium candelabrum TaxID=121492 RepID=UPI002E2679D7|nr:uncharacterized protein LOC134178499 [Corticium candelabrum]
MADECTDVSNKEQFVIVIRWVSEDLQERESFIGLYEADSTDANRLVHSIKDVLLRLNVNISHCCGQCYHRALNIRGSRNRVATQILSCGHPQAICVCREALEIAYEITILIKYSPKRNAAFNRIKAEISDKDARGSIGIRSFCPTRWTVRGDAITSLLENCSVLSQLWEESLEARMEPDLKGRLIGVKTQLGSHRLLIGLKLSEKILRVTDNLCRTLQKTSLSAAEGQTLAKMTIET